MSQFSIWNAHQFSTQLVILVILVQYSPPLSPACTHPKRCLTCKQNTSNALYWEFFSFLILRICPTHRSLPRLSIVNNILNNITMSDVPLVHNIREDSSVSAYQRHLMYAIKQHMLSRIWICIKVFLELKLYTAWSWWWVRGCFEASKSVYLIGIGVIQGVSGLYISHKRI